MTQLTSNPPSGSWIDQIHRLSVRVYYEDTDFTGLVYHANYLKYFERGRTDALRTAGIGHAELLERDPPLAFVIGKIAVDYRAPARIDDALLIETRFFAASKARLSIGQTARRGETVLAAAEVEAACIDLSGRVRRLPQSVVEALAPYVTEKP